MVLKLPSADSTINYLNTQGKDSSFNARKKMFTDFGMNTRLGDFQGTPSQNRALLSSLQATNSPKPPATNQSKPIDFSAYTNTTPASSLLSKSPLSKSPLASSPTLNPASSALNIKAPTAAAVAPNMSTPSGPTFAPPPVQTPTSASSVLQGAGVPNFNQYQDTTPKQYKTPNGTSVTVDASGNTGGGNASPDETTSAQYDAQTSATYGISASDIVPDFNPSEADLINDYLSSQDGQNLMDRVRLGELDSEAAKEEARAALETKYASDFKKTEETLAANGLAFSGIRTTQLKALADNLAASELSVDREFASKLLDADLSLREGIQKGVADLIKEAQAKNKDAIQQLNAVGLAVVNNKLVPTLAARSAERADQQFQLSERRLALSEAASARAEARFEQLYGRGKEEFFSSVQALLDRVPTATEQDIRLAIRSNPDIFGDPSEAEINDAVTLVGMPMGVQEQAAASLLGNNFTKPNILSRLQPGDQGATAFEDAKKKTKQDIIDSGGIITVDDKKWKLNSKQLEDLLGVVDTLTQEEVNNLTAQ